MSFGAEQQEALAWWLAAEYPDTTNVRIDDVRTPAAGASNETLLCDVIWERAGALERVPLVVRMQPTGVGVFPTYDLALQYRTMERLAGSVVPVPHLLGYEPHPAPLGAPFYLMERIDGVVPTENPPYHLTGWLSELPESERAAIWFAGIDTVARVSQVDWQERGFAALARPADGKTPLLQQLEQYRRFGRWAESLGQPYPLLWRGYDWLRAHAPRDEPTTLCWGDAKLANCLFRDGACVAALDWEMVHLGNPVDDLAWWLTLDRCLSEGWGFPRLAGLPSRDETVARWEAQSGASARDLPYYEVFGAFKFSIIMARVGTLLMQQGVFPAESEFDVQNGGTRVLALLLDQVGA